MRWLLKAVSILDEPSDVLICSANPHLTLSGGVGSDLLARYGSTMQDDLMGRVRERTPRFFPRGSIIEYQGEEIPYSAVLHAVAVDGWYESSPEIIQNMVDESLSIAARHSARKVTLTALATGFGHLTLEEFGTGISRLAGRSYPPIESVTICLMEDYRIEELARAIPDASIVS